MMDLLPCYDTQSLTEEPVYIFFKIRISLPHPNPRLETQPQRITPIIPFRTVIRPHPDNSIQSHIPDKPQESLQVMVSAEVPLPFPGLMKIPESIDLYAIKTPPLDPEQPVLP